MRNLTMGIFGVVGEGLDRFFKDYERAILETLWKKGEKSSGQLWKAANEMTGKISRASVIFFCNYMSDELKLLDNGVPKTPMAYYERSGKGGYHRIYSMKMSEAEFKNALKETVSTRLEEL